MPRPTSPRPSPRSSCSAASPSPSNDCCRPGSGRECYLPLPLPLPLLGLSFPPAGSFCACYRACRVGLAARRAGCQRNRCHPANQPPGLGGGWSVDSRPAPPHARAPARHRRAGLGVLCDQAEGGPDEGPSSAPATTRNWPRRRSDRSTGPPREDRTLTTLPEPAEAKRRQHELALSASPARRDGGPLSRGLARSRSARTTSA
jgi:hypothetical protein